MAQIGTDIELAAALLKQDELVGIPTETVYGLAGNALSEPAILKIYEAKNRPKFDPLIAHTYALEAVEDLVEHIPKLAYSLAEAFWPGPLTMLLPKTSNVPDLLTSGLERIAIRIPNHPLVLELLSRLDFPLAAPSANPFGYVSPTTATHVADRLGDKIPYILDGGPCHVGLESTIVGFENDEVMIYRLGGTRVEAIEKIVGKVTLQLNESSNPAAPGMLKSHYSPGRKMIIGNIGELLKGRDPKTTGIISFQTAYDIPTSNLAVLSPKGSLEEAARNIFSALRKMDQEHIELILAEFVPNEGLGRAINDRLRRAAV